MFLPRISPCLRPVRVSYILLTNRVVPSASLMKTPSERVSRILSKWGARDVIEVFSIGIAREIK